jgi:hypothetical protein
MALDVIIYKKNGNTRERLNPVTNDDRIDITSNSSKLPSGITTVKELIDALGSLAFEDYVALNVSDESNYGLVKISSADSSSDETVPTSAVVHAVKTTAENKVSLTGAENVSGVKNFTSGISVAGQPVAYDASTQTFSYGDPILPPEEENS